MGWSEGREKRDLRSKGCLESCGEKPSEVEDRRCSGCASGIGGACRDSRRGRRGGEAKTGLASWEAWEGTGRGRVGGGW